MRLSFVLDDLCSLAKNRGAAHAAIIAVQDIKFNEDFRMQCEQNTCGSYDKNWMCPPQIGPIIELRDRVLQYDQGLLFQSVYQLKSSFDWRGMQQAILEHTMIFRNVIAELRDLAVIKEILPLNAGPCTYCARCAFLDGLDCHIPEEAVSSVEAYGIDVMALEKSCGMPYYNGKDTVSCVSLVLFK